MRTPEMSYSLTRKVFRSSSFTVIPVKLSRKFLKQHTLIHRNLVIVVVFQPEQSHFGTLLVIISDFVI
jgi:hypothetical protein